MKTQRQVREFFFTAFLIICGTLVASPLQAGFGDQLAKFTSSDGGSEDHFSHSMSINGDIALISARFHDHDGLRSGAVYVVNLDSQQEVLELQLSEQQHNQDFGASVSLDGNRALIGATGDHDAGFRAGAAYIFDVATGQQMLKLTPTDGFHSGAFGWSSALKGNHAVVGTLQDDFAGSGYGSAYLFDASTGEQLKKLTPSSRPYLESFGYSVAISDATALVGAPSSDSSNSGSVYAFDLSSGQQIARLAPADGTMDQRFGTSLAIDGNLALIGALGDRIDGVISGSAYLFDLTTGQQLHKFVPNDPVQYGAFGFSVALDGDLALIGAWAGEYNGINSGSAYLFNTVSGQQLAKLGPDDAGDGYHFGYSVALRGNRALVGARDDGNGSAYLFDASVPEPSASVIVVLLAAGMSALKRSL